MRFPKQLKLMNSRPLSAQRSQSVDLGRSKFQVLWSSQMGGRRPFSCDVSPALVADSGLVLFLVHY
jgi:hypothetical protein